MTASSTPLSPVSTESVEETEQQTIDLRPQGLTNPGIVRANWSAAGLVERALELGEGVLSDRGALVTRTGERTGRSPKDRFIVSSPSVKDQIWWGELNQPIEIKAFDRLHEKVKAYLQRRDLYVVDAWACADERLRLPVRIITEKAWHALFARCLFIRPDPRAHFEPELTVIDACDLKADPKLDGVPGEVFVLLNLKRKVVLIGGTQYAGEIKKAVFSYLNFRLPQEGVFPMHCSANIGPKGDSALFFGLSGTGKTTLSADRDRQLVGDDEHGWSDDGVFNIEGGCYAKCVKLSKKGEPQIWNALQFGSILENVVLQENRVPDFNDISITENTRAAYPVEHIDNAEPTSRGGHPSNVIFLTCDAFGVLPPISRLTPAQALYHFLSGYTAKVGGTETGITEPKATFSTCFAAPFLPLHPSRYAEMLREKLQEHGAKVWLINTGWTGGPYGRGERIELRHTRSMIRAALGGALDDVETVTDPIFRVEVPVECPDVPSQILQPKLTWDDTEEYEEKAKDLAELFRNNFERYAEEVSEDVCNAGPAV